MEFDDSSQQSNDLGDETTNGSNSLDLASADGSPKQSPRSTENLQNTRPQSVKRRAKKLQGLSEEEAEIRRIRSNEQERVRQKAMTDAFSILHSCLPENPEATHKKGSKAFTLETAIDYIHALQQLIADYDGCGSGLNQHPFENQCPMRTSSNGSDPQTHISKHPNIPHTDHLAFSASNDAPWQSHLKSMYTDQLGCSAPVNVPYKRNIMLQSPHILETIQDEFGSALGPTHSGFEPQTQHMMHPEHEEKSCLPHGFQIQTLMPLTRQLQNVSKNKPFHSETHHQQHPQGHNRLLPQSPVSPKTWMAKVPSDLDIHHQPGNKENGFLQSPITVFPHLHEDSPPNLKTTHNVQGHQSKHFQASMSSQEPHFPHSTWHKRFPGVASRGYRYKSTHQSPYIIQTPRRSKSILYSPQNSPDSLRIRSHPYLSSEISQEAHLKHSSMLLPALSSSIDPMHEDSDSFNFLPPSPKFPPEEIDFSSHCSVPELAQDYSPMNSNVRSNSVLQEHHSDRSNEPLENASKDRILSESDNVLVSSKTGHSNFLHSTPRSGMSILFDHVFPAQHTPINATPQGHVSPSANSNITNYSENYIDGISGSSSFANSDRLYNYSSSGSSGYISSETCQSQVVVKSFENDCIKHSVCDLSTGTDKQSTLASPRKLNFNS